MAAAFAALSWMTRPSPRCAPGPPAGAAGAPSAAARQYVRKVSGIQKLSDANREPFEEAVAVVTEATTKLLAALPARKQPPQTVPPLRRPEVRARIAAKAASSS